MTFRSGRHSVFGLMLFAKLAVATSAQVDLPCESLLTAFSSRYDASQISKIIVAAITKLFDDTKLSHAQLVEISTELSEGGDGLSLSDDFVKLHQKPEWFSVYKVLNLVKIQLGDRVDARAVHAELKSDWQTLATNQARSNELKHDVERSWRTNNWFRILKSGFHDKHGSWIRYPTLWPGDGSKLSLTYDSSYKVLIDLSDDEHPRETVLPSATWNSDVEHRTLSDNLFINHSIREVFGKLYSQIIFTYDFNDPDAPEVLYFDDASVEAGLYDSLVPIENSIQFAQELSSGRFVIGVHIGNKANAVELWGLDSQALTVQPIMRQEFTAPHALTSNFITLPGNRVFGFGRMGMAAAWTMPASLKKEDFKFSRVEAITASEQKNDEVLGLVTLRDSSVLTLGRGGHFVHWTIGSDSSLTSTEGLAKNYPSTESAFSHVYEMAPGKILTIDAAGNGALWNISNLADVSVTSVEQEYPVGIANVQLSDGNLVSYSKTGEILYSELEGDHIKVTSIPLLDPLNDLDFVSGKPMTLFFAPLPDGNALLLGNVGIFIFLDLKAARPHAMPRNEELRELFKKSPISGMTVLPSGKSLILTNAAGLVVEVNAKDLSQYSPFQGGS